MSIQVRLSDNKVVSANFNQMFRNSKGYFYIDEANCQIKRIVQICCYVANSVLDKKVPSASALANNIENLVVNENRIFAVTKQGSKELLAVRFNKNKSLKLVNKLGANDIDKVIQFMKTNNLGSQQ